ncbi:MAG: DUF1405 domain-containing protein [Candidatus Hodarchaeales archaeon]
MSSAKLVLVLAIGNFLGAVIGFIYYFDIIGFTSLYHPIFWILVPDCPMAALLLVGVYLQKDNQSFGNFNFLVFIQSIRGAAITYLLVLNFPSIDIEIVMIGHTLLIVQALAIVPLFSKLELNRWTLITILITGLNDFIDFFGLFNVTNPTLAQYSTFKPLFSTFVFIIYSLDFILICIGLVLSKFLSRKPLS